MRTIAQVTGALFAVAMAVAPAWAKLTFTDVGLPAESNYLTSTPWTAGNKTLEADTAFTGIGTTNGQTSTITSDIRATNYNLSLEGSGVGTQIAWKGTIAAKTIYLKQGRFSPADSASLGFLGEATVYVKGQFFANANASGATTTGISLRNDFYFAPSSYTESNFDYVSIRVHDGNLSLTGKVTLLPESTSSKGTVKVKTGNDASANRTLTLSQLDLTQVAVGGNTTECLTVEGDLTVVFANGATLNLPTSVVDQGWVKVLTAGTANFDSFNNLTVQLVQPNGDAVDSQQYTVVKNAAMGSIKVIPARESRDFERTLSTANEHWTAGAEETLWGSAGVNPSEIDSVALTVATPSTLTLSEETTVTSLTLNGPSALTFRPTTSEETTTGSLTVFSSTEVNTDTEVSATAHLGAVTLASGKTLTAKSASDFSSITAGSGATVKYTAPSGSIAKVDNATVELAAGANSISGITLPSAGGTYKVSSGTYTEMTLARTATATTYAFTGGDMTFNGEFSFGKATATISDGTIRAPKMVTVQGGKDNRTSTVTQTGGDIILSGEKDGLTTENAVLMFGHWRNGTSTYTLSGGSITAASGGMRFGNDSPSTLNLSGTGILKVKGIWGKGEQTCALNLSGGKLSLGSEGFKSIANLTVTATGGEINAFASNTIAQAITVDGPTTFSADADCTMTVSGALSGTGTVTKSGAGKLSLTGTMSGFTGSVEVTAGTLDLGTSRPTVSALETGAVLKLTATEAELITQTIRLAVGNEVTSEAANQVEVFTAAGAEVDASLVSLENGTLTLALANVLPTLRVTNNTQTWTNSTGWPASGAVKIDATAVTSAEKVMTIPAPESTRTFSSVVVMGPTGVQVTLAKGNNTINNLIVEGSVAMAVTEVNAITNPVTVNAGGVFEVVAASDATLRKAISGAGKFAKGGSGTLTLVGANITTTGGSIVQSGELKFSSTGYINASSSSYADATGDVLVKSRATLNLAGRGSDGGLLLREVTLEANATFKNETSNIGTEQRQFKKLTLRGDATVEAAANFGLVASGYDAATLTLGDYTLTKTGGGTFWLSNCTIIGGTRGGTLKVEAGTVSGNGQHDKARPITISGNVTLERAEDAEACFDFTQADRSTKPLTIASGATLKTAGPAVADGIKLGYTVLTGDLVANNDVSIEHLKTTAEKTLTGTGTITVKNTTLAENVTLTTLANMVLDLSDYTEASPKTIAAKVVVGADSGARDSVTLTTKGYLTLSNTSNKIAETGKLVVASGITTLSAASGGGGIKGNLTIASNATLKCGSGDAPRYSGSQTFDISGTLEITDQKRWTISSEAKIKLHAGARLKGTGPARDNNYAFDFWKGGAITADGDATIEATLGDHIGGQTLTIEQSAGTTTITGEVRSGLTLKAAGSGKVVYNPAAEVTATTSSLVVDTGATLQLLPAADFTLSGTVTGAGTLVKSGAGTLSLTGMVSAPVEVAAGTLDLGMNRPTIGGIADVATLKLTATTAEETAGAMVLPTTLAVEPDKARFSVENLEISRISLVNGMLIIRSASATPTWTLSADGSTGSWNDGITGWPNPGTVVIDATALEADAKVALPASTTFTELIVVGSSAKKTTLTVGERTTITTLSPLGYVAMEVDAVNAITNPVTVAAGGIFEVTVKTGETKPLSKAISGAGKFAKGGTGTLTLNENITTEGGSIVQEGTLKFAASGNGTTTTKDTPGNYTSNAMGDVRVCENAVLDLNGRADLWLRTITLAKGATYKNSDTVVGEGSRQLRAIVLEGDATVEAGANFGLVASGFGPATLDLGGNTLTKEGTGSFWLTNCTISNGTLAVKEGTIVGNSKATSCRISGEVTLERAKDAVSAAKFDFTLATTEATALTVQEGATLTTAGPAVADGIKLGYTVLMGNLVANSDVLPTIASHPIASLTVAADSTVTAALLNCVTGSTTVESGKTLSLSGTDISLTKLPTGTGSVKIPAGSSVTYENGANAYSGRTTVQGELTLECGLDFTQDGSANPTYPIDIAQGGTVTLANGASTYRSFRGAGDLVVTGTNAVLGIPGAASVEGGFDVTGNVRVNSGATLTVTSWTSNAVLSGANLQVDGQVIKGQNEFSLEVAANKTLSGTGVINVPVTFADGAVLDTVTAAPLVLKGKVTGTIKVKLNAAKAVLTATSDAEINRATQLAFASDTTSLTFKTGGYRFVETLHNDFITFTVMPPLALPELPEAVSGNAAAQDAIYDAVAAWKGVGYDITSVTAVTAQSTGGVTGNVEALALFENLYALATPGDKLTENTYAGTVTVYYDFGISQLHVKSASLVNAEDPQLYVLFCAKVATKQDTSTADYAGDTTVSLLLGGKVCDGTEGNGPKATELSEAQLTALGIDVSKGEKWFAVPMKNLDVGTNDFTVKATK